MVSARGAWGQCSAEVNPEANPRDRKHISGWRGEREGEMESDGLTGMGFPFGVMNKF